MLPRPITPLHREEESIQERARRINKLWRENIFISCWSSAEHESYALWKIFCGSCAPRRLSKSWPTPFRAGFDSS
jgi:hypothetical protein